MAIATQTASSQPQTKQTQEVDFYFDVSCPWAWRTALWIREVAKVRPIQVNWKFLSLAKINEAADYSRDSHVASHATFPLLARARAQGGNEAVERLYVALGQARHERKESLADAAVIERALTEAGLDPAWRTEASRAGDGRPYPRGAPGRDRAAEGFWRADALDQWSARFLWAGYHFGADRRGRGGVVGPYRLAGGPRRLLRVQAQP